VSELLLVMVLGLIGPMLAAPRRFGVPVAVGELVAGVVFGDSGLKIIDVTQPNLHLLSQIGFALVMMVTASHINIKAVSKSKVVAVAARDVLSVALVAAAVAGAAVWMTGQGQNFGLYTVILASSSAAVVLPIFAAGAESKEPSIERFITQVTLADLTAIVALPIVGGSGDWVRVGEGALAVTAAAIGIYLLLKWAQHSGAWKRTRKFSALHGLGLELRLSLILLLGLIILAQSFNVTIMIAGFGLGLAIAANGMPRRLAKQLFAVSEGLFSPIFFVLLGAGINVSAMAGSPSLIGLALLLGLGAIAAHLAPVLFGSKPLLAVASSAQLGVPAAAVSIGLSNHSMSAGQAAAVMLAALITLAATAIAAAAKK